MAHPLDDGTAVGLYRELEPTVSLTGPAARRRRARLGSLRRPVRAQLFGGARDDARRVPAGWRAAQAARAGRPARRGAVRAARGVACEDARAIACSAQAARGRGCSGLRPMGMRRLPPAVRRSPAFYLNLLGHAVGWPSPRGGAQALTDALVAHLSALGGELVCDAPVERILTGAGRAAGVALDDGREYKADLVLADVMPRALLAMTGETLHGWYRSGLVRFRQGPATLKLDWALDGPIPWAASEPRGAGTVHIGGDEASTIASLTQAHAGLAERPFLLLGQQSIADPSRAPDGKHTAWAYTHGPASHSLRARLGALRGGGGAAGRALRPGLPQTASSLATCWDHASSRSATATSWTATSAAAATAACSRCSGRCRPLSPYRTPVDGLFLCSAATFPGGAVHGVPGDSAARAALRTLRRRLLVSGPAARGNGSLRNPRPLTRRRRSARAWPSARRS